MSKPAHDARGAQREQQLLAVVRELVDAVAFRVDDPDVFLGIVGADFDVVRTNPHLVPLRPVLGDLALLVQDQDAVLEAPVDARAAVAGFGQLIAVRDRAACLAQRQSKHGKLQTGSKLRQPDRFRALLDERQFALRRDEHPVRALGEHIHRHGVGPLLVARQAL
jgi:hypothetical protein